MIPGALSHCTLCNLWLEPWQHCPHIGPQGFNNAGRQLTEAGSVAPRSFHHDSLNSAREAHDHA